MFYVLDTHTLVWFFTKSKNLSKRVLNILLDKNSNLIIPTIVLAEIKYLHFKLKIPLSYEEIYFPIYMDKRCLIYPLDEEVVENLAPNLELHDSIICSTAQIVERKFKKETYVITKDKEITKSKLVKVLW